jgi:hypothetical protein
MTRSYNVLVSNDNPQQDELEDWNEEDPEYIDNNEEWNEEDFAENEWAEESNEEGASHEIGMEKHDLVDELQGDDEEGVDSTNYQDHNTPEVGSVQEASSTPTRKRSFNEVDAEPEEERALCGSFIRCLIRF